MLTLALDLPEIHESDRWWQRSQGLIPGGTQTLAKGPGQFVRGVAPKYARRGRGGHLWDVDGTEYLDLGMAIGPLILGYANRAVDDAIRAQLDDGITFTLMHPLEIEVAEEVRRMVPCAESVRFSKTGADATSAAVRLARAYTKRSKILCCGYHGWHDWYIAVTDRSAGIPSVVQDLSYTFDYNDLDAFVKALDDDVAAVILEPLVFENPAPGFLEGVRSACTRNGTVLIFDEMWTGFRLALGGAQEHFGVTPDLATFSKAIANGMPLSVLCGRGDIMRLLDRDVFFYTTFGGEALSLAAALATMHQLRTNDVPSHLAWLGAQIKYGVRQLAAEHGLSQIVRCSGPDCRSIVTFDAHWGSPLEMKSLVQQELIRRRVLWAGTHTLCYAHDTRDVVHLFDAYSESFAVLREALETNSVRERIRGEPVEPVFRRTGNFNMKPAK